MRWFFWRSKVVTPWSSTKNPRVNNKNKPAVFWRVLLIFHQFLGFPDFKGISIIFATIWGKSVVWGRYNLTRMIELQTGCFFAKIHGVVWCFFVGSLAILRLWPFFWMVKTWPHSKVVGDLHLRDQKVTTWITWSVIFFLVLLYTGRRSM